jgi:hypothetical protein
VSGGQDGKTASFLLCQIGLANPQPLSPTCQSDSKRRATNLSVRWRLTQALGGEQIVIEEDSFPIPARRLLKMMNV